MRNLSPACTLALSAFVLVGCNPSSSAPAGGTSQDGSGNNLPPSVTIQASATTVGGGEIVELSAIATDDDGTVETYSWTQNGNVTVDFDAEDLQQAEFESPNIYYPLTSETIRVTVTVTDNDGAESSAFVDITTQAFSNSGIQVIAGDDQDVKDSGTVSLSASVDSVSHTITGGEWTQISGPVVTINNSDQLEANFEAIDVSEKTDLVFQYEAQSDVGASESDTVTVSIYDRAPLNDTGVSLCTDYAFGGSGIHNADNDCDLTEEISNGLDPIPFGQDGHYGRDANDTTNGNEDGLLGFSFAKLHADSGAVLNASASTWGCVLDNVTGLVWEVKLDDDGLRDADYLYTWYSTDASTNGGFEGAGDTGTGTTTIAAKAGSDTCYASDRCDTEKFVSDVNATNLCGRNDWRLPTVGELQSIIDYSKTSSNFDSTYFPFGTDLSYWTSQTDSLNDYAFTMVTLNGNDVSYKKEVVKSVMLVSSGD